MLGCREFPASRLCESPVSLAKSIWSPQKGLRVKFRCVFHGTGSGSSVRRGWETCCEAGSPRRRRLSREEGGLAGEG